MNPFSRFELAGASASPDGERREVFLRHDHLGVRLGLLSPSGDHVFRTSRVGHTDRNARAGSCLGFADSAEIAGLEFVGGVVAGGFSVVRRLGVLGGGLGGDVLGGDHRCQHLVHTQWFDLVVVGQDPRAVVVGRQPRAQVLSPAGERDDGRFAVVFGGVFEPSAGGDFVLEGEGECCADRVIDGTGVPSRSSWLSALAAHTPRSPGTRRVSPSSSVTTDWSRSRRWRGGVSAEDHADGHAEAADATQPARLGWVDGDRFRCRARWEAGAG